MKSKLSIIIFLGANLVFSLLGFCQAAATDTSASDNLVLNGDFEEVFKNQPNFWSLDAWHMEAGNTKVLSETGDAKSGNHFVTIENIQSNDARLVQDIPVKPSTVYLMTCYVKVSGIPEGKTGANIGIIEPGFFTAAPHFEETNGKWEFLQYAVRTGSDQTKIRVGIRLGFYGSDVAGKASFDDFRLVEPKDTSGLSPVALGNSNQTLSGTPKPSFIGFFLFYLFGGLILITIIGLLIRSFMKSKKADKHITNKTGQKPQTEVQAGEITSPGLGKSKADFTKTDIFIVAGMMIVYGIIAFANLGIMEAPTTYWQPSSMGENVTVDFGSEQQVKRIYFWQGLPGGHSPKESKYEVEGSTDGTTWTHMALLNPQSISWWWYEQTNTSVRYVRLTSEIPGSWLNEVVFFSDDTENPIKIEKLTPGIRQVFTTGKVENLFDEYSAVGGVAAKKQFVYRPQVMTGMPPHFDEQYHARTALEFLNGRRPYEDTHPPLGKLFMSCGILIFGMNPFGWRFAGTFFGLIIIPLMFAFGKRLFKRTEYGFIAAFLMMFDFMHFTQSRLATIDTFPVFFIILTFYFMHKFWEMSYVKTDFKKLLVPLLLSGISWGLGAATKWTAAYAWLGLAVLFFVSLYVKAREVREAKLTGSFKQNKEERPVLQKRIEDFPKRALQLVGWATLVFVVVPVIIYCFAFLPIFLGKDLRFDIGWIIENNIGMFRYHSELKATHPSTSPWWQWPLMVRPIPYFTGEGLPAGQTQRIYGFGNPAVWWIGSLSILVLLVFAIISLVKRIAGASKESSDKVKSGMSINAVLRNTQYAYALRFFILIGFATVYVPWIVSPRQLIFIYHFFPSVPFIILAIVYLIKVFHERVFDKIEKESNSYLPKIIFGNGLIFLYLAIVMGLFIMFYPVLSGIPVEADYVSKWLRWFPTWSF